MPTSIDSICNPQKQVRGEQLTKLLLQLKDKYPQIAEVRGPGLMVGVEFFDERDNTYPFPGHDSKHTVKYGFSGALGKHCLKHGMLLLNTGYSLALCPIKLPAHNDLLFFYLLQRARNDAVHSSVDSECRGDSIGRGDL